MLKETKEGTMTMYYHTETTKEIEIIKKKNLMEIMQLKSIITEMKNSLEWLNSKIEAAELVNLKTDQWRLHKPKNRKKNEEK